MFVLKKHDALSAGLLIKREAYASPEHGMAKQQRATLTFGLLILH